jgi:1-acyl-sn-glycerol-3-phosphate acyltransferase
LRRFVGAVLFYAVLYGSVLGLGLIGFLFQRRQPFVRRVARLWARANLAALRWFCGVQLRVTGLENLPPGGVIIAAQHQAELDILIWLVVLPNPVFVLKQELLQLPIMGALLRPAGMIPVDRAGGAPALRGMVTAANAAVARGAQVVIFPEGTRVIPGERATLHPGVAALARTAKVIPAATNSGLVWGRHSFRKKPGIAAVKLYPAAPLQRAALMAELAACFYDRPLT